MIRDNPKWNVEDAEKAVRVLKTAKEAISSSFERVQKVLGKISSLDGKLVQERYRKYCMRLPSNGLKSLGIDLLVPKNVDEEKHLSVVVDKLVGLCCYNDVNTNEFIAAECNREIDTSFNLGKVFVLNKDLNLWRTYEAQVAPYYHKAKYGLIDSKWGIMREGKRSDNPVMKRDSNSAEDVNNCVDFVDYCADPNGFSGALFTTGAWFGTWVAALRRKGFQTMEQPRYYLYINKCKNYDGHSFCCCFLKNYDGHSFC